MMKEFWALIMSVGVLFTLNGCAVGHNDYAQYMDSRIGQVIKYKKPYKFHNAGEFSRGNYVINGQGLTHITEGKDGNLIYHFSDQEVLPNYHEKEWVGKCLTYETVDAKTYIIKSWGFDEGSNPLSCRTWR